MAQRGEKGDTGRVGDQGRVGDPGATGDVGPAGESGPTGEHGEAGPKGVSGNVAADRRQLIFAVWVVTAFVFLALLILVNQHRIGNNAQNSRRAVYVLCTDRNATTTRQNAVLDRFIAAEKAKPHPDPLIVKGLTDFRGTISDCGPKP